MKKIICIILCLATAVFGFACTPEEKPPAGTGGGNEVKDDFSEWQIETDRKTDGQHHTDGEVVFPSSLWDVPAAEPYPALDRGDIKAYFIDSVNGEKVFCYVGIPKTASAEAPVPAVVLVHGATGTAFYDWVAAWVNAGYAAIAPDTEGRIPTSDAGMYHSVHEESPKKHGPPNYAFGDAGLPTEQQWAYHAVAAVIASASFIGGQEGVDSSKLGITGVSYGGFLTCLAAGYDDRFLFAAPVYGCLANTSGTGQIGELIEERGAQIWDGTDGLAASNSVFLFVNGNVDMHFSLESTALSAKACKQASLCIKDRYPHGHSEGALIKEIFAFADEIFKGTDPLARVTDVSDWKNGEVRVALPEGRKVRRVEQYYTSSEVLDTSTVFEKAVAEYSDGYAFFSPYDYKYQYIVVEDDKGRTVSTSVLAAD